MHVCLNRLFHLSHVDDDNRIVLQPLYGHSDCQQDYINACYINVGFSLLLSIMHCMHVHVLCFVIRDTQMNTSLLLVKVRNIGA